jgi:hypothetical protein
LALGGGPYHIRHPWHLVEVELKDVHHIVDAIESFYIGGEGLPPVLFCDLAE